MAESAPRVWWYAVQGTTFGPYTAAELAAFAAAQRFGSADLVWKDGAPAWVPANRVKGLFPAEAATGGTPPPLPSSWPSSVSQLIAAGKPPEKDAPAPNATPAITTAPFPARAVRAEAKPAPPGSTTRRGAASDPTTRREMAHVPGFGANRTVLVLACVLVLVIVAATAIFDSADGGSGRQSTPIAWSAEAKFGQAFPPAGEIRVMDEELRASLARDRPAANQFDEDYRALLALRAATCGLGLDIGLLDSVADVRKLPVSPECLKDQDARLDTFLGIRSLAFRLALPALRPVMPLGAPRRLAVPDGGQLAAVHVAAEAGVAVLQEARNEMTAVEFPGGTKIAGLGPFSFATDIDVSPNGRVMAVSESRTSTSFHDLKTGRRIWNARSLRGVLAWLPELSAALASADDKLVLIDFQAGTIQPHPLLSASHSWALSVSREPSRVLVGHDRSMALIEHARSAKGIEATVLKNYRTTRGSVSSQPPTLMEGGRTVFFVTGRDFMAVDLATGQERFWKVQDAISNRYAKLSESEVLVTTLLPLAQAATTTSLFDISKETLAAVTDYAVRGNLQPIRERTGFVVTGRPDSWTGDKLTATAPVLLDTAVATVLAERAKLVEQQRLRVAEWDRGRALRLDAAERMALARQALGARADPWPAATTAGPVTSVDPTFADLARNSKIEAIGVYEGRGADHGVGKKSVPGVVEVVVRRSSKPVLLVLSSYEPVVWKIVPAPGATISGVLLSGAGEATLSGLSGVPQAVVGDAYCYQMAECAGLYRAVEQWTGRRVESFQGRYQGSVFTLGSGR